MPRVLLEKLKPPPPTQHRDWPGHLDLSPGRPLPTAQSWRGRSNPARFLGTADVGWGAAREEGAAQVCSQESRFRCHVRDALEGKAQAAPPSRDSRASPPGAGGTLTAGEGAEEGQRDPAHRLLLWVKGSAHQEGNQARNPLPPAEGAKHCAPALLCPAPNPIMTPEPHHDPQTHHDSKLHHDPPTPS